MTGPAQRKLHPLILAAAVSLTLFSLLGSAAIAGLIRCNCTGHANAGNVRSSTSYTIRAHQVDGSYCRIHLFTNQEYAVDDPVRVVSRCTTLI